jgi:hypothetical protein
VRVRRSRVGVAFRLWFLLAVLGLFGAIVGFAAARSLISTMVLSIPFVVLALVLAIRRGGVRGDEQRGTLRVDEGAISIDGEKLTKQDALESAWVAPHANGSKVVLAPKRGRGMPFELFVHREEDARKIVRTLGLDVDKSNATAKVRSPIASHTLPLAIVLSQGFAFAKKLPWTAWTVPLTTLALIAWLVAATTSREVVVGRDGVRIRWFWRSRFVPHRSIARVEKTDHSVVLYTADGEAIDLPLRPKTKKPNEEWSDEALGLYDRIERARKRDGDSAVDDAKLLERDARATKEWVAALRDPNRVETFRRGELDAAQLWRVVEDGDVEPERRAAAAVALSTSLDEGAKSRLRIAAKTSAEPKLRVALEAAADEDEPAMTRAMERMRRR